MTCHAPAFPASIDRRRLGLVAGAALCAGLLLGVAGCANLGAPTSVGISESELTLLLARQFPMERKVMEVIDLQVTNPQLRLLPDQNRIASEFDLFAFERLLGSRTQGHVALDYALRFEPSDHTIRVTQVRVRDLRLESGPNALHGAGERIGTLVAEDLMENLPVYKMKQSQVDRMESLGLTGGPVTVTPRGIQMAIVAKAH
jgi:hypothetical protein